MSELLRSWWVANWFLDNSLDWEPNEKIIACAMKCFKKINSTRSVPVDGFCLVEQIAPYHCIHIRVKRCFFLGYNFYNATGMIGTFFSAFSVDCVNPLHVYRLSFSQTHLKLYMVLNFFSLLTWPYDFTKSASPKILKYCNVLDALFVVTGSGKLTIKIIFDIKKIIWCWTIGGFKFPPIIFSDSPFSKDKNTTDVDDSMCISHNLKQTCILNIMST